MLSIACGSVTQSGQVQFCFFDIPYCKFADFAVSTNSQMCLSALQAEKYFTDLAMLANLQMFISALQAEKEICRFCLVSKFANLHFCVHMRMGHFGPLLESVKDLVLVATHKREFADLLACSV